MRAALNALNLSTSAAAAGGYTKASPAEYRAAYLKARTYAVAHQAIEWQPSCRAVIGRRSTAPLLEACGLVAGGTTHMQCRPSMSCEAILERLSLYCMQWQGDVPCVAIEDGGEDRSDPAKRGEWRPRP